MLPTSIIKWAERYEIDQDIVWEIVETVTDGEDLDTIRDETHLFDLTFEWVKMQIESAYEDPTRLNTQAFLIHYLPIVYALAPYLMIDRRSALQIAAGSDTPILTDAIRIVLDRDLK